MTKRKIKYTIDELYNIHQSTLTKIYAKHTTSAKTLSAEEIYSLLCDRSIPLRLGITKVQKLNKIYEVFDFSILEHGIIQDQEKIKELSSKVFKIYTRCKDGVALGGNIKAIETLGEFRIFCRNILEGETDGKE